MNKSTTKRRTQRIRRKLKRTSENRLRLSVYRSARNISGQIIDDKNNKTLVAVSSVKEKVADKNKKREKSIYVAELLAKKALEKKITQVYFDRGGYKYHGRIKLFAEALRKKGLNF